MVLVMSANVFAKHGLSSIRLISGTKYVQFLSKIKKLRRLVRTPTLVDGTLTAVDIVERVIQYTKIMLAYVESAQAYVEIAAAYAESTRAAAESARVAIKAARTAQVEIMKMVEGKESS
ncbi:hypothetical protein TRIUR3_16113 [Triticum urartu]|uniref:Uncharacterized protein n=1 Tax=Triticum urartu TaxID=4572 RepID=M7ZGH5_TRIUA|nr:hypothetical protein TRIUR3_16113 [Triticum urartu]